LPAGVRCTLPNGQLIDRDAVGRLTTFTDDPGLAASALLELAVLRADQPVPVESVQSAERALIGSSFGGSRARYLAALRGVKLTVADAQALIAGRLARDEMELRFRPKGPPAGDIGDFLATYAAQPARLVQTTSAAPWLDGRRRGWVVSSLGPPRVFGLTRGATIATADGPFQV